MTCKSAARWAVVRGSGSEAKASRIPRCRVAIVGAVFFFFCVRLGVEGEFAGGGMLVLLKLVIEVCLGVLGLLVGLGADVLSLFRLLPRR